MEVWKASSDLLKREPENSAPAEEAFQTSIAVAKQQGARSYERLAALRPRWRFGRPLRPERSSRVLASADRKRPSKPPSRSQSSKALVATSALLLCDRDGGLEGLFGRSGVLGFSLQQIGRGLPNLHRGRKAARRS